MTKLHALLIPTVAWALGCQGSIESPGSSAVPAASGGSGATAPGGGSGGSQQGTGGAMAAGGTGGSTGGSISTGGSSTGGTGVTAGSGGSVDTLCQPGGGLSVGRTRLRRMSRSQFNHTVRDLLGITGTPADAISPDERIGPFYSNAIAPITDLLVQQHDEVAAALAQQAMPRMNEIAGCDLAADTGTTCAASFIDHFGERAHRRPLEQAEHDEYLALYTGELARGTPETAFELVVATMLESPFFLYHVDRGSSMAPSTAPGAVSPYELASRLSYFLWDTMPDAELFDRAADGTLVNDAVLTSEVDRMLTDAKAGDAIPEFHLQWLGIGELVGLDKDAALFPSFNPTLADAMAKETATFTDYVVRRGDGLMSTLFTAPFSFPEGPLFALYGVTQPAGFVPGTQVALNPGERSGILTQASVLTAHAHRDQTSPVHRGIMVRENMLCQPLDPPPLNVNTTPPAPTPATTTRERFEQHEADPVCGGCHVLIDPIGLAFENYDAIGAYRATENGMVVDASGEILDGAPELDGGFVGAIELGQKLAASRTVADCMANQWFRFALGRMESADDACSMQAIHETFAASGNNVRSLLAAIVKSDAFRNVRLTAVAP